MGTCLWAITSVFEATANLEKARIVFLSYLLELLTAPTQDLLFYYDYARRRLCHMPCLILKPVRMGPVLGSTLESSHVPLTEVELAGLHTNLTTLYNII